MRNITYKTQTQLKVFLSFLFLNVLVIALAANSNNIINSSHSQNNSGYKILGVVLKNGEISFKDTTTITGVVIQKMSTLLPETGKLVLGAFTGSNTLIAENEYELNGTLLQGCQLFELKTPFIVAKGASINAVIINSEGKPLSSETASFSKGNYKGLPVIGDWITNPLIGSGPGVMTPSKVPAGIDPDIVNTKNLAVQYVYDENYPSILSDNLLWYKTGAYDPKATIYDRDGADWEQQALPIGNGYLAAMLFGMPGKDHIQFNEETFWAAGYRGVQKFVGPLYINPGMSEGINGYMNAGNLFVDFNLPDNPTVKNYYRDLNLNEGTAQVQYQYNGITYKREYFASYPSQVMVFRYTSDKKGALNFSVHPVSAHPGKIVVNNGEMTITGNLKDSEPYRGGGSATFSQKSDLEYCIKVKVIADSGLITDNYAHVQVAGATNVTILVTAATDYDPSQFVMNEKGEVNTDAIQFKSLQGLEFAIHKAENRLKNTENKNYEQLKNEHVADFQKLFNRVSFSLTEPKEICQIPTNELQASYKAAIPQVKAGQTISIKPETYNTLDQHLEELHFNYARYLLISSSRETTFPANLQGKWNQSVAEIWGSCYCININLEMNYWFAGSANLAECNKALIVWLNSQISAGRITSRNMYDIIPRDYKLIGDSVLFTNSTNLNVDDVFIMHTKQSINGQTDMTGSRNIQSPGNTAFLMYNVWDYYLTTGDLTLLKNEVYPLLRSSSNFYTQYMLGQKKNTSKTSIHPKGYFYTVGSGRSPEHGPTQEGVKYDLQLIAGLFDYTIRAAEILGIDKEKVEVWKEIRQNIDLPVELGSDGQVKEWAQEAKYNERADGKALGDPFHRHISHLVGLYPGTLISKKTPEFLKGAEIVLHKRGDDATGWSIANKFLMWARVMNGEKALQLFRYQLAQRTYANLFDFHSPFQIDGNFGAAAGIIELLMQSQTGIITILPALPLQWKDGQINGIKSKTGAEVSIKWANNRAYKVTVIPSINGPILLEYPVAKNMIVFDGTKKKSYKSKNGIFTIPNAKAGIKLNIEISNP